MRGECVRHFSGSADWLFFLRPVAFSPDGRRVLVSSQDQTARVWDLDTGKQLACFSGHRGWGWRGVAAVAFLPDGRRALSRLALSGGKAGKRRRDAGGRKGDERWPPRPLVAGCRTPTSS